MRWNTSTGDSRPGGPGRSGDERCDRREYRYRTYFCSEASARWDEDMSLPVCWEADLRFPGSLMESGLLFYYASDEVIVVASERPVIQTVFDLPVTEVKELMPGQSIVVKRNGNMKVSTIHPAVEVTPCSFEQIYFSREVIAIFITNGRNWASADRKYF